MKKREYKASRLSDGHIRMLELLADIVVDGWIDEQKRRSHTHESFDIRSLQLGQAKRDLT